MKRYDIQLSKFGFHLPGPTRNKDLTGFALLNIYSLFRTERKKDGLKNNGKQRIKSQHFLTRTLDQMLFKRKAYR